MDDGAGGAGSIPGTGSRVLATRIQHAIKKSSKNFDELILVFISNCFFIGVF